MPALGENQGAAGFGHETSREMSAGPWTGLRRRVAYPRRKKSRAVGQPLTTTSEPTASCDPQAARSKDAPPPKRVALLSYQPYF